MRLRVDGLSIAAIIFLMFMGFNVLRDQEVLVVKAAPKSSLRETGSFVSDTLQAETTQLSSDEQQIIDAASPENDMDLEIVVAPYDDYIITQGLHGFSYGHAAIDISGGKNAEIKSPINGIVSASYIDEWGNTTLILENERYQVLMLHGIYTVGVGVTVAAGQAVGTESNQGNTFDMNGRSCRGRDCGYHTHLNIYDKILATNVDPLYLIEE
jgi:murein DD-endopeptidase MepM/ murein hydrolase activator NlpD